jgi:CheY-like chemotaxis protein
VKDTGIGIPEEKIEDLFKSFTQVDASTTRLYGGTGLGLAIIKRLCKLMGGDIKVTSKLNEGSEFTFFIQLEKSDAQPQKLPDISIHKIDVLVVDDNATNLTVMQGVLEKWGANVTLLNSGKLALEYLENSKNKLPQIAFLDMQMPNMDGIELAKRIRSHSDYLDINLIMMTSMGSRGDARKFADLGFKAYFPKPFSISDLHDAIAVVITGGKVLDQANPLVTQHYLKSLQRIDPIHTDQRPTTTKILLAEDNHINQAVVHGILENLNYECDIANNGNEVIEKLKESEVGEYQLILMDCQMPELDGYEATKKIRDGEAGSDFKDITIIALTANAFQTDKDACLEAGMNDFLSKPIDTQKFEKKLDLWLNCQNTRSNQEENTGYTNESPTEHNHTEDFIEPEGISEHSKIHDKEVLNPEFEKKLKIIGLLLDEYNTEVETELEQLIQATNNPIIIEALKATLRQAQKYNFEEASVILNDQITTQLSFKSED